MQSFGVKHLLGSQFRTEQVCPTGITDKAVHSFIFENGRIKYDGPYVTPVEDAVVYPRENYQYHIDLTGRRFYQVTPVEGEEPVTGGGGGGPPGKLDWGYHRLPPEQREMGVRRDVQDLMDLTVLLISTGLLDE